MYESFFGFRERPFSAAPNAADYIAAESIELARQTLARAVERAEGPALLIGPAGTGKSQLCLVLAELFRERYRVALLSSARLCTRRALLQNILFEMNLPFRDRDEGELRLSLMDHLLPSEEFPSGLVLIVDEAHVLPLRLLEEIRMITNLVRDGVPRVRLILAGGPQLEERFAHPRMAVFNQRVAARCYLQPFNRDETFAYVQSQLSKAGGSGQVFAEEALQAAYSASDGIPRLINQVCDHALVLARAGGVNQIDAAGIQEAWADLQQLPGPWEAPGRESDESSSVVEFGGLDEEPHDEPQAASEQGAPVDPMQQIEQIQLRVADVQDDDIAAADADIDQYSFSPSTSESTEVDLVFHGAHDPFGDAYAEEEVVIDRYASLDADSLRLRSSVRNASPAHDPPTALPDAGNTADHAAFETAADAAISTDASAPSNEESAGTDARRDDRDIIVEANTSDGPVEDVEESGDRRLQYRQLFVSLRKKCM